MRNSLIMANRLILGAVTLALLSGIEGFGQEVPTTFEFVTDSYFAFEDSGSATVEVRRSGTLGFPGSVDFLAAGGIAEADVDFVPQSGTLMFAPGEDSKTFSVPYIDDAEPEGSEPIELTLRNPSSGSSLGALSRSRLYIQDNERRGSLLDPTFDGAVASDDFVSDLALLPDGRILATGAFLRRGNPIVDRVLLFDSDGFRDGDFDMDDEVPNSSVFAVALQADGKVLIGGTFTSVGDVELGGIARINADGTVDESFSVGSGIGGDSPAVFEITVQTDGKILVGGPFETYNDVQSPALVRLNSDGSVDTSFDLGTGIASRDANFSGAWVSRIVEQSDGKILVSGQFTDVDGNAFRNLVRLNGSGGVDAEFDIGAGATGPGASVEGLAVQPDGRILIGGDFSEVDGNPINGIARLLASGAFDSSFDPGRGVEGEDPNTGFPVPGLVNHIEVLDDGNILVAGNFETIDDFGRRGIGRLLPNGVLDGTFGPYFGTTYRNSEGYEEYDSVSALVVQPDGKAVTGALFEGVDGSAPARLSRLLARNELENTVEFDFPRFSVSEGAGNVDVRVIRRGRSDEAFSVDYFVLGGTASSGEDYELSNGRLTFDALVTEQVITIPIISDDVPESNETIELAIRNASNGVGFGEPVSTTIEILDRTKPGNLDLTFERIRLPFTSNPLSFRPVTDLIIQPDRKIVASGYFTFVGDDDRAGLVRFNLDGTVDPSFIPEAPAGDLIVEFVQMGLQPDGSFVGGLRAVNQLNAQGALSPGFTPNLTFATTLSVGENGDFVVSDNFLDEATGGSLNEVVRFNSDGSVDAGFIPAALNDWAITSLIQPDGKVVLGGWFTDVNGVAQNHLVRLNENGSRDREFDIGLGVEGVSPPVVISLLRQPDGKILVGGEFSLVDGLPRNNIARLNSDGSLDTSFDPGAGPDAWVESIALQSDGKILIGGGFGDYDGVSRRGLARLNPDGSLDEGFESELFFPDARVVSAIEVQEDGQILVGGSFTEVNGLSRPGLARLNGDNAADIPPIEPETIPAAPASELRIELGGDGDSVLITFQGTPGGRYAIESTNQLSAGDNDWQELAVLEADSETVMFNDDSLNATAGARFYRVIVAETP